jgi:hypothetical protein
MRLCSHLSGVTRSLRGRLSGASSARCGQKSKPPRSLGTYSPSAASAIDSCRPRSLLCRYNQLIHPLRPSEFLNVQVSTGLHSISAGESRRETDCALFCLDDRQTGNNQLIDTCNEVLSNLKLPGGRPTRHYPFPDTWAFVRTNARLSTHTISEE